MPRLEDSVCRIFGHEWKPLSHSGEITLPKCKRCNKDYLDYFKEQPLGHGDLKRKFKELND